MKNRAMVLFYSQIVNNFKIINKNKCQLIKKYRITIYNNFLMKIKKFRLNNYKKKLKYKHKNNYCKKKKIFKKKNYLMSKQKKYSKILNVINKFCHKF